MKELEKMYDLLLLNQIELARTKEQLSRANAAIKELERVSVGGGSIYRIMVILNKLKVAL